MSFPTYPEYKDSGVPWLGEVPGHWTISRIKDQFEIRKRIAGELGHDVLSITQSGLRVKDIENNEGQQAMDYSKYQLVYPGDFAMNHMDLLTGWIDIAERSGVTSPDYRVFAARFPDRMNARFFLRVFQLAYSARQFYPFGQGSSQLGRWRLPTDAFYGFPIPYPPRTEQAAIAAFLDQETAKIDALVAEQERLIGLLKEKRRAVISHAVTKGINPHALMKDSGIDWLGQIPAHWEVGPLKRYMEFLDGRRIPLSAEERGGMQGDYPYYGASGIIDYVDDYIFDEPLVLVSEDGANLLMRNYRIAFVAEGKYWVNNHAHIVKPKDGLVSFWADRIEAIDLSPVITGAAQPKLTADALEKLRLAVPSDVTERREIEAYVNKTTAAFSPLMQEAQAAIILLQERRAALISAAVTGKIDVRGLVDQQELEAA